MTLSFASSKSVISTERFFFRAANNAASFTMFSRSAPTIPGVPLAMAFKSTFFLFMTIFLVCTFRIPKRPFKSGTSTTTCRSNRPGRSKAESNTSGRFVAAMRMISSLASKPSISTKSAFNVCSRSSWPPPNPAPR